MAMRSHYCGLVTDALMGQTVSLCGWVNRRRDHGGVIFVDLRDREGYVQVVCDPDRPDMFKTAEGLRNEFCVQVKGLVRARPEGTVNDNLKSGKIEVLCQELIVLNPSVTPPFQIDEDNLSETTRLTHRVLDLRRPYMQNNLMLRYRVSMEVRKFLDANGFVDIETPMLTKSTPEGARDYLVPSRVHDGQFFALPQSPQLFKQLLMVAGFDRYYQITKCFRDEDLRADRQPEFTQLDIEMSFIDEADITTMMEDMIRQVFKTVLNVELPNPFPRLTYADAMQRYGSDKPDLRNPLELVEVADLMREVDFKVFAQAASRDDHRVTALRAPGGGKLSRKQIDDYTTFVAIYGAKGLAYIKVNDRKAGIEGLASPIVKFMPPAVVEALLDRVGAEDGDLVFFGADKTRVVNDALGALRDKLAADLGLVAETWAPLWVVDFPMFEWDEEGKRWAALHHPFTAPADADSVADAPGQAISRAYDMVLNGSEIGGGSIRIHNSHLQSKVFGLLGIGDEEAQEKFGFLLEALQYGCPPHGGIAFGLDRLAMLMAGETSIREVIAFPKTQSASCPLTSAPSEVSERQLRELSIRLRKAAGADKE